MVESDYIYKSRIYCQLLWNDAERDGNNEMPDVCIRACNSAESDSDELCFITQRRAE